RETCSTQSSVASRANKGMHSEAIRIFIFASKLKPSRGILLVALRLLCCSRLVLEAIFLHPPVQSATAQTERLGSLTHITIAASQRLADENTFYSFEAHIFKPPVGDPALI